MSLDDDVRNLARNATLGVLEPDALRLLAFSAETRLLRAGDTLFRQGEAGDGGYFVLSGAIALEPEGGGPIHVAGPSALIGELALLTELPRPATAVAREPSSVLRLPRTLIHRVLGEHPVSAARLQQALAQNLADLGMQIGRARQTSFVNE